MNIRLNFTFSNEFKGFELAFPFLGHNNDDEVASAAQSQGGICKVRQNVVTSSAEF